MGRFCLRDRRALCRIGLLRMISRDPEPGEDRRLHLELLAALAETEGAYEGMLPVQLGIAVVDDRSKCLFTPNAREIGLFVRHGAKVE